MKKPTLKKLGLAAETIRNLSVAELEGIAGGFDRTIVVTTTHSKGGGCLTDVPLATTACNPGSDMPA